MPRSLSSTRCPAADEESLSAWLPRAAASEHQECGLLADQEWNLFKAGATRGRIIDWTDRRTSIRGAPLPHSPDLDGGPRMAGTRDSPLQGGTGIGTPDRDQSSSRGKPVVTPGRGVGDRRPSWSSGTFDLDEARIVQRPHPAWTRGSQDHRPLRVLRMWHALWGPHRRSAGSGGRGRPTSHLRAARVAPTSSMSGVGDAR